MPLTITEAGLAAATNEEGTGLSPVTLTEVQIYDKGAYKTTIPLQGVELIEPARIYVVAEDSTSAEYDARELRFYTNTGVWFATVKENNNAIIQSKGRASSFLLALELTISQAPGTVAPSGNITFQSPYATETLRGVMKFATDDEALNGQSSNPAEPKAMTPENVREHGDNRYSPNDHNHNEDYAPKKHNHDGTYFKLDVTTRLMFASWPLPQGWTLDTSHPDRMAMLTNQENEINTLGGDWRITGMIAAGKHAHSMSQSNNNIARGVSTAGTPYEATQYHTHTIYNNGEHAHAFDGQWRPAYRKFALGEFRP